MLTITTLASGSSGNSLLVSGGDTHILIDAGISCRRITTALNQLDVDPNTLAAVLVTHAHTDHVCGLATMVKKLSAPIYASAGGTVISSGWSGGYGYLVKIRHSNGWVTYYAHCSALLVKVGETVTQGQQIARVGSTGNSTGPHLHFEIRINGKDVNPMNYIG